MNKENAIQELASIKKMMERSSMFISLSGLSGILAGLYSLIGLFFAQRWLHGYALLGSLPMAKPQRIEWLILDASFVLVLSVGTGLLLSYRKARRKQEQFWSNTSRALIFNAGVPLLTGGILVLILIIHHVAMLIPASFLIFYGLSMFNASHHTFRDIRWLGFSEVVLGLIAGYQPQSGLLMLAIGFGVLHILYGTIMYFKYDRETGE